MWPGIPESRFLRKNNMLDVFVKNIKPEKGFKVISDITFSMNALIENLNENNFNDLESRNHMIDYVSYMIKRQKHHE